MAVSNTKLLDFDTSICEGVEVQFWTETWEQFDQVILWLVKNGVLLGVSNQDDCLNPFRVVVRGKHPYADGKMLNHALGAGGYVTGEESGIRYEVQMPDDIRR